jgi:hypothetical protein
MQINVNGKTFEVPDGSSINVINDNVYVNGEIYTGPGQETKDFKIEITGGLAHLSVVRGNVTVNGNTEQINCGGSVSVTGSVTGNVDAGGSVNCGNISGDVDAGGSVNCGSVGGDIDAGGSVRHK